VSENKKIGQDTYRVLGYGLGNFLKTYFIVLRTLTMRSFLIHISIVQYNIVNYRNKIISRFLEAICLVEMRLFTH
jgi:hypothetical protein